MTAKFYGLRYASIFRAIGTTGAPTELRLDELGVALQQPTPESAHQILVEMAQDISHTLTVDAQVIIGCFVTSMITVLHPIENDDAWFELYDRVRAHYRSYSYRDFAPLDWGVPQGLWFQVKQVIRFKMNDLNAENYTPQEAISKLHELNTDEGDILSSDLWTCLNER